MESLNDELILREFLVKNSLEVRLSHPSGTLSDIEYLNLE